jgi:hypothetical protein
MGGPPLSNRNACFNIVASAESITGCETFLWNVWIPSSRLRGLGINKDSGAGFGMTTNAQGVAQ